MVGVDALPWPSLALILLVVVQRLTELRLSARNAARLRARGAREVGAGHYPLLVAIHTGFIAGLAVEVIGLGARPPAWWPLPLVVFLAAQALRYWTIATLGPRWTTRIYVLPGAPLVTSGPYRYLRHPNYAAVLAEFAALPLVLGATWTLAIFLPLNAAALAAVRIPCEEAALEGPKVGRRGDPG